MDSKHVSTVIRRSVADVYAYLSDPAHLPEWAAGLGDDTRIVDGELVADMPGGGRVKVDFVARNQLGVFDHWVTFPDGTVNYNPVRVVANGDDAEVIFTVRRQVGVSDADFERDAAAVQADLETLGKILGR